MQRIDGIPVLSASDLMMFLACRHASHLDLRATTERLEKAPDDAISRLLKRRGTEHEAAYLETLRARHGAAAVDVIAADRSDADRLAETRAAMRRGMPVIYQAALQHLQWRGYADFLLRVEEESELGAFSYEATDTKLSRRVHGKHALQLGIYSALLEAAQGRRPYYMHLQLGDGSSHRLRASEFLAYVNTAAQRLADFTATPPAESYPERCAYCPQCGWRERCDAQWITDDHLIQVAGIRNDAVAALQTAGVKTLAALAGLPEGARIAGISEPTLARLRAQAALQHFKRATGNDRVEIIPAAPDRGFARLPRPDPGDLFFDMEGDPLHPGGLEYLFGFFGLIGGSIRYRAFWAHDKEAERSASEEVIGFLDAHLAAHPDAHIYHYNTYEDRALKRLASLYGVGEAKLDTMLRQERFVDLYRIVLDAVRVSEPGYSLKNLEIFFAGRRSGDVTSAQDSITTYEAWRESGRQEYLDSLADYNRLDCQSTAGLRDWLVGLRPEGLPWFKAAAEPPTVSPAMQDAEERLLAYERKLTVPATDPRHDLKKLAFQLLEFHRRENKPKFWRMYDRQGRSPEELIDDAECIGGAVRDRTAGVFKEKRSRVFTYAFPPQDSKLRADDTVKSSDTLLDVGEIHSFDEEACRLAIRIGPSRPDPADTLSLIPKPGFPDRAIREAMYRFADSLIAGDDRFRAVRSVLERGLPRISGLEPGQPIRGPDETPLEAIRRQVPRLDESHVFIQGPPGTGKTYTASRVIVDLVAAGRRVGVASNSHKAINNLLKAVEEAAATAGVDFYGIKKSSGDDTFFNGTMIRDVTSNDDVDPRSRLIAGTVYLFARPEFEATIDFLFVDEAGQVSIANIVAMGLAARNIVLIGDQMQLSQPIQGVHPDRSGLSALDFLLGDAATIAPERGIFLDTTRRLHPGICRFISDAVYDGRLEADPACSRRVLVVGADAHPAIVPSGISMVDVAHQGCAQKSEAEGRAILGICASLLQQRFLDERGEEHPLAMENILIVAPYNVQVNHLKSILPENARVGTVDKFQGQEAEVVILSMTTSSPDDLPRDIEFLYSRNRLNVAISRARSLAIVVANPKLLDVDCTTIEQMRLVNTLCWIRQYARREDIGLIPRRD